MMVLPILWATLTSLAPPSEVFSGRVLGVTPTLANHRRAVESFPVARLVANTFLMASAVTIAQVVVALLAAYGFVRYSFAGRGLAFAAVVGTILVPQQILIVPNYLLAAELGWVDTYVGLVIPQVATCGVAALLLCQHMRSFPRALIEAARLDGASDGTILWRVMVPNLGPAISAVAIVSFIGSWNEYLWPLLIAQDDAHRTVQVGLQAFQGEQGTTWGPLMAAATMASVPVLAVYAVAQRRIVDGFVRSGIG